MKLWALFLMIVTIYAPFASAEQNPGIVPPSLSPATPSLEWLQQSAARERTWATVWGTTWAVATGAQLTVLAITDDRDTRVDMAFGAGGAALGLIPTFILRPYILRHESQMTSQPAVNELYRLDQADKRSRRGVLPHVANVAINLGLSAGLGFGYGRWVTSLLNCVLGIPIGIAMIETQPSPNAEPELSPKDTASFTVAPLLAPQAYGLALGLTY